MPQEIEIYYLNRNDLTNIDTFAISYVPLDNANNTAQTQFRESDLYNQAGTLEGKYLVIRNRYRYLDDPTFSSLAQINATLFLSKGNLSGIFCFENGNNSNIFISPSYQSGYYFNKNVTIHLEELPDGLTRKITIVINY
jgi:hypothetical protein